MLVSKWGITSTVEDWERGSARKLMVQFGIFGIIANILCMLLIALPFALWNTELVPTQYEIFVLLAPWAIILVFGSRYAFHKGVVDEYDFAYSGKKPPANDSERPHFFKADPWEREYVNSIVLGQVIFAAIGTLALVGLNDILEKFGFYKFPPEILFSPWIAVIVIETSKTYHYGVLAQRIKIRGRRDTDRRETPRRAAIKKKTTSKKKTAAKKKTTKKA